MRIRGFIFDLGGVAVEWSNYVTYAYIERRYGISAVDFKIEAEKGMPRVQLGEESEEAWMRETFSLFGLPPDNAENVWGTTFEAASYNKETLKIVQRLRRAGYRVAALSNLEPSRARWLRGNNIDTYFDDVVFSCDVGLRKPDLSPGRPEDLAIYRYTLRRLGLTAQECVFIDDNLNCVEAAESTGMHALQFRDVAQLEGKLNSWGIF